MLVKSIYLYTIEDSNYEWSEVVKEYIKSLRTYVGHMPILMCGASVIVYKDGHVLLQRRADNGCWSYHGGAVELGERVEDAAARELFEETGLRADGLQLYGVFSGEGYAYTYPNGDMVHNVDTVFICEDYEGEPVSDNSETTALRWFSVFDIPESISPPTRVPLMQFMQEKQKTLAQPSPAEFWQALDALAAVSKLVIDRPRGSAHPRFSDFIYPLDYGFLEGTASMDGGGIDVWRGSLEESRIDAVVCIVDLMKKDSEIKLLIGCTEAERAMVQAIHNETDMMKGILIVRPIQKQ